MEGKRTAQGAPSRGRACRGNSSVEFQNHKASQYALSATSRLRSAQRGLEALRRASLIEALVQAQDATQYCRFGKSGLVSRLSHPVLLPERTPEPKGVAPCRRGTPHAGYWALGTTALRSTADQQHQSRLLNCAVGAACCFPRASSPRSHSHPHTPCLPHCTRSHSPRTTRPHPLRAGGDRPGQLESWPCGGTSSQCWVT